MDVGSLVSQNPQLVAAALVLSGGMLLLNGFGQAVAIWDRMRRKPSLDQELQHYAKKSDLAQVEERLRDDMSAANNRHEKVMQQHAEEQGKVVDNIFSRINTMQRAVELSLQQIMHELGRISGRTEKKG
jgi:hypothetical protein